jgi:hypothetical protein
MSEEQKNDEVMFGVSLEDLARVHAAEQAGVKAEERLAELRLDRATFSRAEQAWTERLATSLRDEPSLFVAYSTALSAALLSDAPRILPLEEDLGEWVSFEGHFQRAADPAELAMRAGLSLLEVARLHRDWAARLAEDPALAEEAARKRAEEPLPLPEIRREPRRRPAAPLAPVLRAIPADTPPPARVPAPMSLQVETVELKPVVALTPAVPFAGRAPDQEAIGRAKEHAQKAQPAAHAGVLAPIGETAPVDVRALMRNVLAFDASKPPAPPQPAGQARSFSMEEYAALSAELSLHPDSSAAIWARVGVHDAQTASNVMAQLNARLNADPAFRQAWQAAYAAHRARIAGARR